MPDREKVIKAYEDFVNGYICFSKSDDYEYEMHKAVLALLKEQEAVEPILEQDSMVCGVCGHEVIWQKMLGDGIWTDEKLDYCPHCGKAVKWNE